MHNENFFAVGNGYACDGNHHRMPFMSGGRKPGKPLPWVGVSLSPVFVGTVMSGMA